MKYKELINHLARIRDLKIKTDFTEWMDELMPLIGAESYGFSRWTIIHSKPITVNGLLWFEDHSDYKEMYFDQGLYRLDPVTDELVRQIEAGRLEAQYWEDTFTKRDSGEFLQAINDYPFATWQGYTVANRLNPITFDLLSVAGPDLEKSLQLERILHCVVHIITQIPLNVFLLPLLTEKQHNIFQLLSTSVTMNDIGHCMKIAPSTVEKHFDAIRRKLHVGWRSDIGTGWAIREGRRTLPEKLENTPPTNTL